MHIISPFIYILYVKFITQLYPCPNSLIMKKFRQYHNIFLSILSFIMLLGITIGNIQTNKFSSLNNLLCKSYDDNWYVLLSTNVFLYSKYLEWGDSLYLHLSGRSITTLQYTHHMTTAFLTYANMINYISPHIFIFMSINCFVHIWMYWYFAFPKGFLKKNKVLITQIQIIQHVICLFTILYTLTLSDCQQNLYGNYCGLFIYLMNLIYFIRFYIMNYLIII